MSNGYFEWIFVKDSEKDPNDYFKFREIYNRLYENKYHVDYRNLSLENLIELINFCYAIKNVKLVELLTVLKRKYFFSEIGDKLNGELIEMYQNININLHVIDIEDLPDDINMQNIVYEKNKVYHYTNTKDTSKEFSYILVPTNYKIRPSQITNKKYLLNFEKICFINDDYIMAIFETFFFELKKFLKFKNLFLEKISNQEIRENVTELIERFNKEYNKAISLDNIYVTEDYKFKILWLDEIFADSTVRGIAYMEPYEELNNKYREELWRVLN